MFCVFPTGGKARWHDGSGKNRNHHAESGEIPAPTVTVRMEENPNAYAALCPSLSKS
jgi:hypothetical protein